MNFCIVITDLSGGGAERATLDLVRSFASCGHQISLILLQDKIVHAVPEEIKPVCVTASIHGSRGWFGKRKLAVQLRTTWERLNEETPFDLTIVRLPLCWDLVSRAKIRKAAYYVDNSIGDELINLPYLKSKRRELRYQAIFSNNTLVACSHGVYSDLVQRYQHTASAIRMISNPVDSQSIKTKSLEQDIDIPNCKYIIHVGRFNKQKRHDLLLKSWKQLTKITEHKLILLTHPEKALLDKIKELGLKDSVLVAGFKTNPYPWIRRSEMLVLCSDYEGLGLVLIEAVLCNTRVVSTNCHYGPSEILKKHPQYLIPCGDEAALSKAIMDGLKEPKPTWNFDDCDYLGEHVVRKFEELARHV